MSSLVAVATGNLTAAATWGLVDSTSILVSTSVALTTLSTTPLDSAAFTPGAITVIGIAVRLSSRVAGAATNTITITLRNSTGGVDVASVTANVSDLPTSTNSTDSEGGWHFFKFSAPVTLLGATNYVVRAVLSSASTGVGLCTNGTANNWQRLLITSTTQAPVAGDDLYMAQTLDGSTNPATVTARTVTMDSTAATAYGSGVVSTYQSAVNVSKACTFTYGTAAATNYILRISGMLGIYNGGTFRIGNTGAEIPRDSTAILEFVNAANGQSGLRCLNGSTVTIMGLSRTSGKDQWKALLSADHIATATTINVDTDTGWKNGDEVLIATTSRVATETEFRTLNADAGATSFTISAGLTNAHLGSGDYFGEVVLMTRNVEIRSTNSSFATYVHLLPTATVTVLWTRFRYFSSSTQIFSVGTTTGTASFQFCVFRDASNGLSIANNSSGWTIDKCVLLATTNIGAGFTLQSTTATAPAFTLTDFMAISTSGNGMTFNDIGGTFGNLWLIGCNSGGINWSQAGVLNDGTGGPTFVANSTWIVHSCQGGGGSGALQFTTNANDITFPTLYFWRNNCDAIYVQANVAMSNIEFSGNFFGNGVSASEEPGCIRVNGASNALHDIRFMNCNISGDNLLAANWGCLFDKNCVTASEIYWYNCKFSENTGTRRPFAVADIGSIPDVNSGGMALQGVAEWCSFGAPESVKFYYATGAAPRYNSKFSYVICPGYGQVAGAHRTYTTFGTIILDTTTFDVTPSQNIKFISTSLTTSSVDSNAKRRGTGFLVPVASGGTVTPSVKVEIDASYNGGTKPQLVLLKNRALGITSDTVLATHSGTTGAFEILSGTTAAAAADGVFEFVVRCYGSAGNAWIDTWSTSVSGPDSTGVKYWNGQPVTFANTSSGGGGGGERSFAYAG